METYIKTVRRCILNGNTSIPKARDNPTPEERKALKDLQKRDDIIIKEADKGSAVVVMNKKDYLAEAGRQLGDTSFYQKLEKDLTPPFSKEVKQQVQQLFTKGLIDKKTKDYLIPHQPRTARFYLLPKINKEGTPGRPIVSSNNSPMENISSFVDYHLQPLVSRIPSYIKDTTDFLRKLQTLPTLPQGTLLITMDVCSLYTNIPHDEGIRACELALDTRPEPTISTGEISKLISTILMKNNFSFNGEYYLQTQGTAMGTKMAPSYANIIMGEIERQFLDTQDYKPLVWWRYIDDIFNIWTHGEESLVTFIDAFNSFHPTIKIKAEYSYTETIFLDTRVYIKNQRIKSDLYVKPTDKHTYLERNSCHPKHCKTFIPYSQAIRLRRICSQEKDYMKRTEELKTNLMLRGYSPRCNIR